ncbi:MAG: hypothetical protein ABSA21_03235 [Candidatus Limnocylindrales bacterium]|jgi:hypothetical protein
MSRDALAAMCDALNAGGTADDAMSAAREVIIEIAAESITSHREPSRQHSEPRVRMPGRGRAADSIRLGRRAGEVLAERGAMTLRQLYYALVSTGDLPKTEAGYGKLKRLIVDLREDGTIPWNLIVDHVRTVFEARTFDGIEDLLSDSARLYRRNLMRDQDDAVQLWAESDSIGSVIAPVAERYTIPTFIGRGYTSRGYLWNAAADAVAAQEAGKRVVILHVGDFDPSGEDIFRDLEQTFRVYAFAISEGYSATDVRAYFSCLGPLAPSETHWLDFERLALTQEQVDEYHLPARPPKASDTRTAKFTGSGAVEVEALPVEALLDIVEQAILSTIDPKALAVVRAAEKSERELMRRIAATPIERLRTVAAA